MAFQSPIYRLPSTMDAKQLTLPVKGMTCANCSLAVERNLKLLDGVKDAAVNLALSLIHI